MNVLLIYHLVKKNLPFQAERAIAQMHGCPLIFQNIDDEHQVITTAGIGTFRYGCFSQTPSQGCRGFIGPVPPPLWIRVADRGYLDFGGDNTISG